MKVSKYEVFETLEIRLEKKFPYPSISSNKPLSEGKGSSEWELMEFSGPDDFLAFEGEEDGKIRLIQCFVFSVGRKEIRQLGTLEVENMNVEGYSKPLDADPKILSFFGGNKKHFCVTYGRFEVPDYNFSIYETKTLRKTRDLKIGYEYSGFINRMFIFDERRLYCCFSMNLVMFCQGIGERDYFRQKKIVVDNRNSSILSVCEIQKLQGRFMMCGTNKGYVHRMRVNDCQVIDARRLFKNEGVNNLISMICDRTRKEKIICVGETGGFVIFDAIEWTEYARMITSKNILRLVSFFCFDDCNFVFGGDKFVKSFSIREDEVEFGCKIQTDGYISSLRLIGTEKLKLITCDTSNIFIFRVRGVEVKEIVKEIVAKDFVSRIEFLQEECSLEGIKLKLFNCNIFSLHILLIM